MSILDDDSFESRVPGSEFREAAVVSRNSKPGTRNSKPGIRGRQRGLTVIELVMFIVVVGVGVAGILLALNLTTGKSADPLIRKQALAAAEALLEEIELMPFTYCDPDDANATTATSPAGCATSPEGLGPEGGETRTDAANPFDNVSDYHGFSMTGIQDITGTPLAGLSSYSASVSIDNTAALSGVAAGEVLRIAVTVTAPNGEQITVDGYRTRHSPNATP